MNEMKQITEKKAKAKCGMMALLLTSLGFIASIGVIIGGAIFIEMGKFEVFYMICVIVLGSIGCIIFPIMWIGLKVIAPKEAAVLTLFGKYYGTIREAGFYWVNPFCIMINPVKTELAEKTGLDANKAGSASWMTISKKISLKTATLLNQKQKVNDERGNPIEIAVVVIWEVSNPTSAVFDVDNYQTYLSTQCDAVVRNIARKYPYDTNTDGDEFSLRGSSTEIAQEMQLELKSKVEEIGLNIIDVRIAHLAYAPEIAGAMLQRQQASAIIDARQKIVEGAVGMVEMALKQLSENNIVNLDDERKAAMVSNLLVVLCGNKDAQPIVNSGSIY